MKNSMSERIRLMIKELNETQSSFANKVGTSQSTIATAIMRGSDLSSQLIGRITRAYPNVNLNWLMTGEGNMFKSDSMYIIPDPDDKNLSIVSEDSSNPYLVTKSGTEYYSIGNNKYMMKVHFVPVHAYAKYIDDQRDAIDYEGPDYFYFPVSQIYHGNYKAFEIKGDSMDNDTRASLANGDVVLGRELSIELWKSPLHINDFPHWIIVLDNTIICKQIIKHDVTSGEITCHSLNSDPAYADFTLNLNEVRELYNIIMVTRSF